MRAKRDTTLASTASTSPCVARENTSRCNHVKTCILGMMPGGERKGPPRMQYIDNIKKWTRASLEEKIVAEERLTSELTPPTKVSQHEQIGIVDRINLFF